MFSKIFSKAERPEVGWKPLEQVAQIDQLDASSKEKPVLVFKHSTRCSISATALSRFERSYSEEASFEPYFLDLIANREVSNSIAERYGVRHESPQAILIKDGKAIFDASHMGISFQELDQKAKED